MAYSRKTTGLGADCVNLIIVDDDDTTVVDLGSAAATLVVDGNVTIEDLTWNSTTFKAFETKSNGAWDFYGITFSANAPDLQHGSGSDGTGVFMAFGRGANSGYGMLYGSSNSFAFCVREDSDAYDIYRNANTDVATGTATYTNTDYTTDRLAIGTNYKRDVANGEQLFVDVDGGSKTAWDIDETSAASGSDATIDSIGGKGGNGYHSARFACFAVFNRPLTLSECQDLRDDWFGELIEAPAGGSILPLLNAYYG